MKKKSYSFLNFYRRRNPVFKLILIIFQVLLIGVNVNGRINKLNTDLNQSIISSNKQNNSTIDLNFDRDKEFTLVNIDSLLNVANALPEDDFTVPSWTLFKRAVTTLNSQRNTISAVALQNSINSLKNKEYPYDIVCSINGSPTSRLGFAWFTNVGVSGGRVEIVQGSATDSSVFSNPLISINAKTDSVKNLNYNVPGNGLLKLAGIQDNTKKTGTFTTAKNTTEKFSFVYFTDPQAQTDASFNISQRTTHAANTLFPDAGFWLGCGDLVESTGAINSEWEYEQFFQTQQDIFLNKPLATVLGNHDLSPNKNFTHHFNTDSVGFDYAKSSVPGSFYSFVYGDALFLGINFMDVGVKGQLDSIKNWMRRQVTEYPLTKWRIVFYHKTIFTGSVVHQSDGEGKVFRDIFTPLFEELKIDLALQGHDHVYEVIGPVKYKTLVANEVSNVMKVSFDSINNVTAKSGGTFNVKDGTLYFLNNSSGPKKYAPRSEAKMDSVESGLGITNYFGLFTGRFGQGYKPTFSNISVSTDTIDVKTFEVNTSGISSLYDNFKIVKMADVISIDTDATAKSLSFYPVPVKEYAIINFKDEVDANVEIYSLKGVLVKSERIYGSSQINLKNLSKGVYTLKVVSGSSNYKVKFIKE